MNDGKIEEQELEKEQEKISFWAQIKEDFCVPRNNDPALDNNLELFFNYSVGKNFLELLMEYLLFLQKQIFTLLVQ